MINIWFLTPWAILPSFLRKFYQKQSIGNKKYSQLKMMNKLAISILLKKNVLITFSLMSLFFNSSSTPRPFIESFNCFFSSTAFWLQEYPLVNLLFLLDWVKYCYVEMKMPFLHYLSLRNAVFSNNRSKTMIHPGGDGQRITEWVWGQRRLRIGELYRSKRRNPVFLTLNNFLFKAT